ncbi:MAG: ABC transporter substrate-binding protein [Actinomycetota bacterium]
MSYSFPATRSPLSVLGLLLTLLLLTGCGSDDTSSASAGESASAAASATEAATEEAMDDDSADEQEPSDDDGQDEPEESEESDDAAAPAAPETKEIEHELGTTTVVGVPERIVVLEYSFADNLGTLDVVPVGYAVDAPPAYLAQYTEDLGSTIVGTRAEPNLEVIATLDADLIIGDLRRHEELYPQLSEIAPTLIFNSLRGSYQDQLDTFAVIADLLGEGDRATSMLDDYQSRFDQAAEQSSDDAGAFVIGVLHADGYTAHSNQSFMGSFLEALGRTNALEPEGDETQFLLGLEGMATVNPSAIIVLCNPGDDELLGGLTSSSVWQSLDAATNDRVFTFDRNLWSKGRGLLAYDLILSDAVDSGFLADGANPGEPSCG